VIGFGCISGRRGGNDEDIQAQVQVETPIEESLQGLGGPMTRAMTKKVEESL